MKWLVVLLVGSFLARQTVRLKGIQIKEKAWLIGGYIALILIFGIVIWNMIF